MTAAQAAKLMGCTRRHVLTLISSGRMKAVLTPNAKTGIPEYHITLRDIKRYESTKSLRGFPRGAKRDGPRGAVQ